MSTELAVDEKVTIGFTYPKKYKVMLLNDDQTPMEFVMSILMNIFHKTTSEAENITLIVHNEGRGIAGIYSYEIAEQKVFNSVALSRSNGFPLAFKIEEV
jgi:ATP-dependent Clp protease adaptor protein ClpS|tara:strand:+ start:6419 stop:6718 length:300 start_codon:yes stop_codon:yes gene_type:complete